ncbi:hypothetical protein [Bifidobacterium pullorum]|uniref:hypothetical protein n=1 Tax=Bifidobacterium pullorum TaxID=78448 RepID=UPI00052962D0|nr:hypothetical protein [Bifidobacterium pullorum]
MTKNPRTAEELETMSNDELAEAYKETFGECYPFEPTYYPVSFLYGGIEADPGFHEKAVNALSTGVPLPRIDLQDNPDPGVLY